MAKDYGDTSIKTLDPVTHIRMRPGMYVGEPGTGAMYHDCIYILMKEVIDNAIDEFGQGYGKRIDVNVNYDSGEVSVRDYGRGIPLGKVVDCVSQMNTGGKYDNENYQFSAGMNGVGTKAVNALSKDFYVCSNRDGQCAWARFDSGELKEEGTGETKEKNGTLVEFYPDAALFKDFNYNLDYVETMIKNYSYLKKGLTLILNGTPYKSENGLLDLVNENLSDPKW